MNYVPSKGDRVRAQDGENVLVGAVIDEGEAWGNGKWVAVELGSKAIPVTLEVAKWTFTRIIEPIKFKPLAVAELRNVSIDDAWEPKHYSRVAEDCWTDYGCTYEPGDAEVQQLIEDGEAELIFEGAEL